MEIHKNTNKQLSDLLNEARHEKPVMNIKDVEKIVSDGKYIPAGGNRGFHIGMNNLIVVGGIVVSSFLAYMALKVDQGDLVSVPAPSDTEVVESSATTPLINENTGSMPVETILYKPASAGSDKSTLKVSDLVQPKPNPATMVASADREMVAIENESDEELALPVPATLPRFEYEITFTYNGQDIKMKLEGEEISELFVDGLAIPADQYGDYDDILSEGKNYFIGNTGEAEGSQSLNLIKYFDSVLRADKILDKEARYEFELSFSRIIVNGNVQSNEILNKYKGLYEARTGKKITDGSVYKFEWGAKSE